MFESELNYWLLYLFYRQKEWGGGFQAQHASLRLSSSALGHTTPSSSQHTHTHTRQLSESFSLL